MNEQPGQPGENPRDVNLAEIGDGGGAADGREAAFIPVVKGRTRVNIPTVSHRMREGWGSRRIRISRGFHFAPDKSRDKTPLLDGNRGRAGKHFAVLVAQGRQVADDEHFRMMRKAYIGQHLHPSGAVKRRTELLAQG